MSLPFNTVTSFKGHSAVCFIGNDLPNHIASNITSHGSKALSKKPEKWQKLMAVHEAGVSYYRVPLHKGKSNRGEYFRQMGVHLYDQLCDNNQEKILLCVGDETDLLHLAEGLWLKNYRFELYKSEPNKFEIKGVSFLKGAVNQKSFDVIMAMLQGVYLARDLVNEPANILTAEELAARIKKAGNEVGYKTVILGKKKIQALNMGGLLAVNRGSTEEPTFSEITYSPKGAKNKKPIVLVGKGIVYDTGGLSLKPTPNSMDIMKCDMGGAAAVVGTIYAAAIAKLPLNIIGLIPATDNQPGPDAYKPGDVIKMYDGTHVEVMNTDAEGRMVLADALAYAQKLDPELAIDLATLTGSSMRALGYYAAAAMGTAGDAIQAKMLQAAQDSWDRIVFFPLWDDYNEDLQSTLADTKNMGPSPFADVIIAGKFLERFTAYPWMHLDIAGPAFLPSARGYLPSGGTGYGVALLFHFLKSYKS